MKNIKLIIAFFLATTSFLYAQTTVTGSFIHDGRERTYSFYVPASYSPGEPIPMLIGLHGLSSRGEAFAEHRDFRPIADTANFIMVHPDGSTLLGIRYWNYGDIFGSTVDDVGFLEALIDTISAQYNVNPNRIYCTGMSNGSFMAYYLACQSDRFAAIGAVTGSMSVNMYNSCNPAQAIPVIHIHGTEDPINPYNGTSTMKAIEETVLFWAEENNCDLNPEIIPIPNIDPTDGATAERYIYPNGINDHSVELIKVIGGEHSWPGSPMPGSNDVTCMDFDASVEIWRFLSQYALNNSTSQFQQPPIESIQIFPNPSSGFLHIQSENLKISNAEVMDFQGRIIVSKSAENIDFLDLNHFPSGQYLLRLSGNNFWTVRKLIILSENR